MEHMRIIRGKSSRKYMVVIRFSEQQFADEFFIKINGKAFNSLEPEVCHLVFVADVKFIRPPDAVLFPPHNLKELPTCPVCLERLDSSESGIVISICVHEFHTRCLAQWQTDATCPVCRYSQIPVSLKENRCRVCKTTENLWICLICGHIGCGRYEGGHASAHVAETQHTYSLELDTQRVWDYTGDGYVHRLVQNVIDGKVGSACH